MASRRDRVPDVERWTGALLKLPDHVFFDIMRNYLGELRTPFNKHTLIEEISSFLRRSETRDRLLDHIDSTDAQVLTAVHVLRGPSMSRLFTFFEGTMSYLELHYLLLNIQERLLIYVDNASHDQRLYLNPFLQEMLEREVIDPNRLFPSRPCDAPDAEVPWPTEPLLLALYSFLSGAPDLVKAGGGLKKRALEEIALVFPQLAPGNGSARRCGLALSALFRLGLATNARGVVSPDHARWRTFAACEGQTRQALFWAALADAVSTGDASDLEPGGAPDSMRAVEAKARVIAGVFANLPAGRAFPPETVTRLASCSAPTDWEHVEAEESLPITDALIQLGLLLPAPGEEGWYTMNPHLRVQQTTEHRPAVLEPNFQLTLKPSIQFSEGLTVASIAEIRRYDVYSRYEVTKRAFVRALELGNTSEEIVTLLERLGEGKLPQNVRFSLASWETEYRSLALYRGVVLTADTERRHLIEHSEAMRPWISRTLSPGVYLLDETEVVEWSRALRRAGIDPLPPIRSVSAGKGDRESSHAFHAIGRPQIFAADEDSGKGAAAGPSRRRGGAGSELSRELLAELDRLEVAPEIASELRARITKKLILFPEQLEQSQPIGDRNEAKGLDYVGKVRLIEQALHSGSELLEVLERTSKGETRRLLVRPLEVTKSGNDLVLHARTLPQNEPVLIRVRKIGLVRKLKSSLYAP